MFLRAARSSATVLVRAGINKLPEDSARRGLNRGVSRARYTQARQLEIEYTRGRKRHGFSPRGGGGGLANPPPSLPLRGKWRASTRQMKLLKRQRHVPEDEAISNAATGKGPSFPAREFKNVTSTYSTGTSRSAISLAKLISASPAR